MGDASADSTIRLGGWSSLSTHLWPHYPHPQDTGLPQHGVVGGTRHEGVLWPVGKYWATGVNHGRANSPRGKKSSNAAAPAREQGPQKFVLCCLREAVASACKQSANHTITAFGTILVRQATENIILKLQFLSRNGVPISKVRTDAMV
jgi:hypothetical protein